MVDFKIIGKRIKYYRVKAGLTQNELSELLDVSSSYISQIERGISDVSLRRLDEIAEKIDTSLQSLVADVNRNSQDFMTSEIHEKLAALSPADKKQISEIIDTFLTK